MRKLVLTILISSIGLSAIEISSRAYADAKSEGVSTEIDAKRIADVLDEVNNAKFLIDTGSQNISKSEIPDQEAMYFALINQALAQSGTKPNEFLMRNILYRTQSIYAGVKNIPPSPKRDAYARRILEQGVEWAQRLYEPDKKLLELEQQQQLPEELRAASFVKIGLQWADYVLNLYYLCPTDGAKLELMRDMMGQMYNDIVNDDTVKRILAPVAGGLVMKDEWLKAQMPSSPVDKLLLSRDLRRFMEQYLVATAKLLESYKTVFDSDMPQEQQPQQQPQIINQESDSGGATCGIRSYPGNHQYYSFFMNNKAVGQPSTDLESLFNTLLTAEKGHVCTQRMAPVKCRVATYPRNNQFFSLFIDGVEAGSPQSEIDGPVSDLTKAVKWGICVTMEPLSCEVVSYSGNNQYYQLQMDGKGAGQPTTDMATIIAERDRARAARVCR